MTSEMSSDTLTDGNEEVEPTTASEKLPDPTLWQYLTAVFGSVVAYAVVISLGMILIVSRVGSPFTWVPGFATLYAGYISLAVVYVTILRAFGANSGKFERAKPLDWLFSIAFLLVAIASAVGLYFFLLTGTPMHKLQGEHGMTVVESPALRSAEPDFTWEEIHGDRAAEIRAMSMSCVELRDDHGRLLVEGLRSLTDLAHFGAEVSDVQMEVQSKSYENMAESLKAIMPLVMVNDDRHLAEMEVDIIMDDIAEVESHIAERCVPDGEYFFRVVDPSQ